MSPRLIAVHHRLAGRTGHRYNQALGVLREAPRRGMEPIVFYHRDAEAEVRRTVPGHAVLHDPVFRPGRSFDERTDEFVAMLHEHVTSAVRRDDRVLMSVATQTEARAFTRWVRDLPSRRKPWVTLLFVSDRWNREGPAERARQLAEFDVLAGELALLPSDDRRRLVFCSHTEGLVDELGNLLGVPVLRAPFTEVYDDLPEAAPRELSATLRLGALGGARPEKGSHRLAAIFDECLRRGAFELVLEVANEQLPDAVLEDFLRLAKRPGVVASRGPLGRAEYIRTLSICDVLLFPCDPVPYRQRPSGIFCEAVACAIPVVVTAGTWMAKQVASGQAMGVIAPEVTPGSFADAILRCRDLLPALRAGALLKAPEWRARESLPAFLSWMEDQIARRSELSKC